MNLFLKYIDLVVQTLCIVLAASLLFSAFMGRHPDDAGWGMSILYAQMVIGPWQMISSGISIVTRAALWRMKIIHFAIALTYILSLIYLFSSDPIGQEIFMNWFLTVPAWILAFYYYFLTWVWVIRANTRQGGFLPHLGF